MLPPPFFYICVLKQFIYTISMDNISKIIISDPGVDDIIALRLLQKLTPQIPHVLISTFGNVAEEYTARNAQEFIEVSVGGWRLFRGPNAPLRQLERPWADYYHGYDGVWGEHVRPVELAINNEDQVPDCSEIISLGPLTGVLPLITRGGIKKATIMGGAFNVPGNETEFSETNIRFDPDSAAKFFEQNQQIETRVIPLDVTNQVFWTKDQVISIPEKTEIDSWLKKILLAWFGNYGERKSAPFYLYDPLAIYSIFYPEKLRWRQSGVRVIVKGSERGRTIFNNNSLLCQVAIDVKLAEQISKDIFDLVFK